MKYLIYCILTIGITFSITAQDSDQVYPVAQEMPTLEECAGITDFADRRVCTDEKIEAALMKYLEYPQEAKDAGVDGFVIVRFVVDRKGKAVDFTVVEDPGFGLADAAIKAVKKIGKWVPGSIRGEDVNVRMSVPVRFQMPVQESEPTATAPEVYESAEQMPRYAGCDTVDLTDARNCTLHAVTTYLRSHLVYPELARKQNITGTVVVQFIIDESGKVTEPKVKESIGSGCDGEAVRLISSMPAWSPGMEGGKPVKVRMELPVKFSL